jgi:2'-5' RNA ligase
MKLVNETLNQLLETKKQSKKLDYGCVMLYTEVSDWNKRLEIIEKEDIYDDEFKDYGLEHTAHCTLLFGLHLDECEPEEVKEFMKTFKPIEVTIKEISIFKGDDYDVVKYDVPVTEELQMYHDLLERRFPNTQTFPDYHPHMTISYVLPGEGKKYAKKVKPFKIIFTSAVYSYKGTSDKKEKIKVKLNES